MPKSEKKATGKSTTASHSKNGAGAASVTRGRRGRRPQKIFNDTEDVPEKKKSVRGPQDPSVILSLKMDPAKLGVIMPKKNPDLTAQIQIKAKRHESYHKKLLGEAEDVSSDDSDNESEGMFHNDTATDHDCHKCHEYKKTIENLKRRLDMANVKTKIDNSVKIYKNNLSFISITTEGIVDLESTDSLCWWDCHPFTTIPCFLPEMYYEDTYHVLGCFCSFNCALAYNLYFLRDSKIYRRQSLLYDLYREMYDIKSTQDLEIKPAPPRELLKSFLGEMSITAYRKQLELADREYIVYIPPLKPITVQIEEKSTNPERDLEGEYLLKRDKPLNKKKSVIATMIGLKGKK